MTSGKGKIRMKDVAEKAGVSIGTVDRVLHNRGEVKENTRKKVLGIIEEMGYTPNLFAKSLASKKILHFAAILPGAGDKNPYWEKPLEGINEAAEEVKNFNAVVDVYSFNAADENSFRKVFNEVLKENPSGVVFNPTLKEASLEFIKLMDAKEIPYVYIDTDLEKGNNLAYFGQNAEQSGKLAAKIISQTIPHDSEILIVKLANNKVISHHLNRREDGFKSFFEENNNISCRLSNLVIDLTLENEPDKTLKKVFAEKPGLRAVFVPNSRVFRVASFLERNHYDNVLCLGFDLIKENIEFLKSGVIDYLIGQKPSEQGYQGLMALFNYLVLNKEINKVNYSPIDLILKENIDFYI